MHMQNKELYKLLSQWRKDMGIDALCVKDCQVCHAVLYDLVISSLCLLSNFI